MNYLKLLNLLMIGEIKKGIEEYLTQIGTDLHRFTQIKDGFLLVLYDFIQNIFPRFSQKITD